MYTNADIFMEGALLLPSIKVSGNQGKIRHGANLFLHKTR